MFALEGSKYHKGPTPYPRKICKTLAEYIAFFHFLQNSCISQLGLHSSEHLRAKITFSLVKIGRSFPDFVEIPSYVEKI